MLKRLNYQETLEDLCSNDAFCFYMCNKTLGLGHSLKVAFSIP
jgi:hypothetical protein